MYVWRTEVGRIRSLDQIKCSVYQTFSAISTPRNSSHTPVLDRTYIRLGVLKNWKRKWRSLESKRAFTAAIIIELLTPRPAAPPPPLVQPDAGPSRSEKHFTPLNRLIFIFNHGPRTPPSQIFYVLSLSVVSALRTADAGTMRTPALSTQTGAAHQPEIARAREIRYLFRELLVDSPL